jgi:mono/diheme cytochrome c family protein
MKRTALILLLSLATFSHDAGAQQAEPLNETQTTGRTLFAQSCVVCHVKVQLGTGAALWSGFVADVARRAGSRDA